jgi:hypothetical protein
MQERLDPRLRGRWGATRVRLVVVLTVAFTCLSLTAAAFWYGDYRYELPTPKPLGLVQAARGTRLPADRWLGERAPALRERPIIFHFFNPDCPCTRFNVDHVRALNARFGSHVAFIAVAQTDASDDELSKAIDDLALGFPYLVDRDGRMAAEAGVYSTPQAVLVNERRELLYRGNYNVSRYCTDPRTEFVRIALESLTTKGNQTPPDTPAYGCVLPSTSPEHAL